MAQSATLSLQLASFCAGEHNCLTLCVCMTAANFASDQVPVASLINYYRMWCLYKRAKAVKGMVIDACVTMAMVRPKHASHQRTNQCSILHVGASLGAFVSVSSLQELAVACRVDMALASVMTVSARSYIAYFTSYPGPAHHCSWHAK